MSKSDNNDDSAETTSKPSVFFRSMPKMEEVWNDNMSKSDDDDDSLTSVLEMTPRQHKSDDSSDEEDDSSDDESNSEEIRKRTVVKKLPAVGNDAAFCHLSNTCHSDAVMGGHLFYEEPVRMRGGGPSASNEEDNKMPGAGFSHFAPIGGEDLVDTDDEEDDSGHCGEDIDDVGEEHDPEVINIDEEEEDNDHPTDGVNNFASSVAPLPDQQDDVATFVCITSSTHDVAQRCLDKWGNLDVAIGKCTRLVLKFIVHMG